MNVDPSAKWTPEIDALIAESAPADYPAGNLRAGYEAGEVLFLTVGEDDRVRAVVAYSLLPVAGRMELRIVGLNARRAPFLIRTAFATLENMLDSGARIVADIETDAMVRVVEHFGMRLRALTYVKDVA